MNPRKKAVSRYLLLFLFLGFTYLEVVGQPRKEDQILFDKAIALQQVYKDLEIDKEIAKLDTTQTVDSIRYEMYLENKEMILGQAILYYRKIIDDYPKSKLYFRAMNNIALNAYLLGDYDLSIEYNEWLVRSKVNDLEEGGTGTGLMANPYALYKNRACKNLAFTYLKQKDYKNALKYLELTKKYPFYHFCTYAYDANEVKMAKLYTKCYLGLNNKRKALDFALPQLFAYDDHSKENIVALILKILREQYDDKTILAKFNRAVKKNYTKGEKKGKYTFLDFYISFMDVEIQLPLLPKTKEYFGKKARKEEIRKAVERSYFYQQLKK